MERQAKDGTIYQQVGQDEWTPVTRQARDGTTYKKVGADQWTPLSNDSEKSLGSSILDGITSVSNKIDSYTGAPTRAAAAAAQEGKNPITAFKAQFGEDNSKAPSFHDIAVRAGVSDSHKFVRSAADQQAFDEKYNPGLAQARKQGKGYSDEYTFSPADVAGVVGDAALDWTNVAIPLGAEAIKGLRALKVGATAADAAHGVRQVSEGVLAQRAGATADAAAKTSAEVKGGGLSVEQGGQLFKYKAPESLDELKNWKSPSGAGEQVGAQRLKEIENVVPDLEVKPLKYHYSMMENPKAMKELKLKFENLPTEDAKRIAAYNQEMVDESARKIQQTASDLAGGEPRNLTDAGYDLIGQVKDKYKTEKAELGPLFNEIQKRSPKLGPLESRDLIQAIGETSNLGKLIEIHPETGRFSLGKNTPRTGLSDAEHGILSRVIDDLNDGMTFKELQDTREFLRKAIDPANPAATIEVSKVRSILLGQLENMASKAGPDVGQVFKKYAINERSREAIESIIGGKIESLDAMFSANPDKVVQKIFSNPNYAKIVGEYVGQDTMKQMVGSYLQTGINKSIDSAKGFQPSKFKSWLKSNENFIRANVDPETAKRLSALADYGYFGRRFLDEVNPSGTAASLKAMLEPVGFFQKVKHKGLVGTITSEVGAKAESMLHQQGAVRSVNEMMGTPPKPGLSFPEVNSKTLVDQASRAKNSAIALRSVKNQTTAVAGPDKQKGPDKWVKTGLEKVAARAKADSIDLAQVKDQLLKNPKTRELFIAASDLPAESKAMEALWKKIKKEVESVRAGSRVADLNSNEVKFKRD